MNFIEEKKDAYNTAIFIEVFKSLHQTNYSNYRIIRLCERLIWDNMRKLATIEKLISFPNE